MSTEPKVCRVTPLLQCADVSTTVRFYQDILGFTPYVTSAEYSFLERDGQGLRLIRVSEERLRQTRGHLHIYVDVSGLRDFWTQVKSRATGYDVTDLMVQDYGMTEFHILDPDGCLVMMGEPTSTAQRETET